MAGQNGAVENLDIERLNTDEAYWSENSNNIPSDWITEGYVPYGYSGNPSTPKFLRNGPNPIPEWETMQWNTGPVVSGIGTDVDTYDPSYGGPFGDPNYDGFGMPGQQDADLSGTNGGAPFGNPSEAGFGTGSSASVGANGSSVGVTMGQGVDRPNGGGTGGYDEAGLDLGQSRSVRPTSGSGTPGNITTLEQRAANETLSDENYKTLARSHVAAANKGPATSQSYADNDPVWQEFYPEVQGRHNLLHDYNSYNYVITLVAISDAQVKDPSTYKGRVINSRGIESDSFYVIAKTGGFERADAVTNPQTDFDGAVGQQSFKGSPGDRDKDLFIDDLIFDTRPGINDMGSSNLTTGRFRVTEPHGVGGFYKELFAGAKFAGHHNYLGKPFLLVISFIGRKVDSDNAEVPEKTTRYIPIILKGSTMNVDEGGAKYDVEFMGYNSAGMSATAAALWGDIEPFVATQETVEQIACSVFHENHVKHQEALDKMQEEADQETRTEVARRLSDQEFQAQALGQAGLASGTNIVSYKAHKYYCWFAPGWPGLPGASTKDWPSSQWDSQVESMRARGQDFTGPVIAGTQNIMGKAGLNDSVAPTAGLLIAPFEEMKQEHDRQVAKVRDELSQVRSQFETEKAEFDAARESLANILKGQQGIREEDLETDLIQDVNVTPTTAVEESQKTVQDAIDNAEALASRYAGSAPGSGPPPTQTVPQQGNLSAEEIAQVIELRTKIVTLGNQLKLDAAAIASLRTQLQTLQDSTTSWASLRYDLTSTNVPWQFKKGTNLQTVLDILITNSQYMEILQDAASLEQIASSEFIPWYRVDVYPVNVAFDVFTMQPVREYHYVVSPFDVHYSKMPGVNIIFSTKKLREMAVREYNYIYTGKNLDVLNFDIKYNNLFTTPLLLKPPNTEALNATVKREEVINTIIPPTAFQETTSRIAASISNKLQESGFTPAQAASRKLTYRDMEISNRTHIGQALMEFLYNPPFEQALIRAEITIVGDPVYIVGSGIVDRPPLLKNDILTPDGEINGFSREPDILFKFKNAKDIPSAADLKVGLVQQPTTGDFDGCYQVVKIENRFSEGVFQQTLSTLRRKNQEQDYEVTLQQKGEISTGLATTTTRGASDYVPTGIQVGDNIRTTRSTRVDTVGPDDGLRGNSTDADYRDGQTP